jgi:hypothetical protein
VLDLERKRELFRFLTAAGTSSEKLVNIWAVYRRSLFEDWLNAA